MLQQCYSGVIAVLYLEVKAKQFGSINQGAKYDIGKGFKLPNMILTALEISILSL